MLYSYNWLKDYLDEDELNDKKWTAQKIGSKLALTLCEYENYYNLKFNLHQIFVGKIISINPHPNADKLSVTRIDLGKKKLQIVCGAKNIYSGMVVPVAIIGSVLPNGLEIKEVELRGIKSEGMLCSAEELGLEEKSTGILDLGKGIKIGSNLAESINFNDEILEFSIPFNRPDALSIIGLAKEIAIATDTKFYPTKFKLKENSKQKIDDLLEINIKDPDKCYRYCSRVIENVKIKESPLWLKRRLIVSGLRPINAVVDITNYVMLEYGQPMHAFDYDLIIGHKINIRHAKKGERIITLDGQKKVLNESDLIIADDKRPLAIAGIMGGEDSGVLNSTRTVVLESANFSRQTINQSSRLLGLTTDSSIRFCKGLPLSFCPKALDRAAYLIQKICGGEILRGMVDIRSKRILKKNLSVDYEQINDLLGIDIAKNEVKKILKNLDFEIEKTDEKSISVIAPEDRTDLEYSEDIIEEIGRVYGYGKINDQSLSMTVVLPKIENNRRYRNKIISYLFNRGWSETISYTFVDSEKLRNWGYDPQYSYELANPLDQNASLLRQSLLLGLLEKYKIWSKENDQVNLFEWGHVFCNNRQTKESIKLGFIYSENIPGKNLFLRAKGLVEGILRLGGRKWSDYSIQRIKDGNYDLDQFHPVNSLVIIDHKNRKIGEFGLLHPFKASQSKLSKNIIYGEFDLNILIEGFNEMHVFQETSKYPVSKFDISLIVDKKSLSIDLINQSKKIAQHVLKDIVVFDEYEGPNLGENKKSISLRYLFQLPDRTLSDEEINKVMNSIIESLQKEFKAVLRDK